MIIKNKKKNNKKITRDYIIESISPGKIIVRDRFTFEPLFELAEKDLKRMLRK